MTTFNSLVHHIHGFILLLRLCLVYEQNWDPNTSFLLVNTLCALPFHYNLKTFF